MFGRLLQRSVPHRRPTARSLQSATPVSTDQMVLVGGNEWILLSAVVVAWKPGPEAERVWEEQAPVALPRGAVVQEAVTALIFDSNPP